MINPLGPAAAVLNGTGGGGADWGGAGVAADDERSFRGRRPGAVMSACRCLRHSTEVPSPSKPSLTYTVLNLQHVCSPQDFLCRHSVLPTDLGYRPQATEVKGVQLRTDVKKKSRSLDSSLASL
ncbi:hypothetical protein M8J77_006084 [Diaphorina citri]|nr:hypothetical protein M8J77_006084 [Diaphorina citri]